MNASISSVGRIFVHVVMDMICVVNLPLGLNILCLSETVIRTQTGLSLCVFLFSLLCFRD